MIVQKSEEIPTNLHIDYEKINTLYKYIVKNNDFLIDILQQLSKYFSEINYKNLYNAIKAIGLDNKIKKDKCQACKTDLSHVRNIIFGVI